MCIYLHQYLIMSNYLSFTVQLPTPFSVPLLMTYGTTDGQQRPHYVPQPHTRLSPPPSAHDSCWPHIHDSCRPRMTHATLPTHPLPITGDAWKTAGLLTPRGAVHLGVRPPNVQHSSTHTKNSKTQNSSFSVQHSSSKTQTPQNNFIPYQNHRATDAPVPQVQHCPPPPSHTPQPGEINHQIIYLMSLSQTNQVI